MLATLTYSCHIYYGTLYVLYTSQGQCISTRELEEMGRKFCDGLSKVRSRHIKGAAGVGPGLTASFSSTSGSILDARYVFILLYEYYYTKSRIFSHFLKKVLVGPGSIFWATGTLSFRLWMTVPMSFKVRVDSLSPALFCLLQTMIPQSHLSGWPRHRENREFGC